MTTREAKLFGFDEHGETLFALPVILNEHNDIVSFPQELEGALLPYYMKVEDGGVLYPCMSWDDYERGGTPLLGSGANSNDWLDWDEYNEWLVFSTEEFCDCEPYPRLYATEIEPFSRSL